MVIPFKEGSHLVYGWMTSFSDRCLDEFVVVVEVGGLLGRYELLKFRGRNFFKEGRL